MLKGRSKEVLKGTRRWHGSGVKFSIERFLRSKLGQPWNKVHSEVSKEFDRRTYAGERFWQALKWVLATHCWIGAETGTIYEQTRYGDREVVGFYVHPFTGILSYQKRTIGPKKLPEPPIEFLINGSMEHRLNKFEGIWYYVEYQWEYQMWLPKLKRQLGRKELKERKLKNDLPEVCDILRKKALEDAKHAYGETNL